MSLAITESQFGRGMQFTEGFLGEVMCLFQ